MLRAVKYKSLEEEVLSAKNILMGFQSGDNIDLKLGLKEGKHTIDVVMPWKNILQIGEYNSEQEARKEYNKYLNQLKQRYGIYIINNKTAKIIKSK